VCCFPNGFENILKFGGLSGTVEVYTVSTSLFFAPTAGIKDKFGKNSILLKKGFQTGAKLKQTISPFSTL
jgi:hypothetical protein